jgi:hypothetical protein
MPPGASLPLGHGTLFAELPRPVGASFFASIITVMLANSHNASILHGLDEWRTMDVPTGKAVGAAARAASLSPEARQAIAKKAASARWNAAPLMEVLCGSSDNPLKIGDIEIECYVLNGEIRVITQASILEAMGRHRKANTRRDEGDEQLPPILQGKAIRPFIPDGVIEQAQPITFILPSGSRASGYRAELLPVLCEIYLSARAAGVLPPNQRHVAVQAEILVRGLAHVGIIALVDEATGYQAVRAKDALATILEAFVEKELQPWIRTFPADYYKEMFRLRGLDFTKATVQRPQYFGHLTNDVIYKRLAPGVLEELKKVQLGDDGKPKGKLFQRLTSNVGYPKLREHLGSVVTLMKLSTSWGDFKSKLDMIHPRLGQQAMIPLWTDEDDMGL